MLLIAVHIFEYATVLLKMKTLKLNGGVSAALASFSSSIGKPLNIYKYESMHCIVTKNGIYINIMLPAF